MTEYGSTYPQTHSDIDCYTCGRWFRTTGDVIAHEERSICGTEAVVPTWDELRKRRQG